jgi:hypothetical protein
MASGPRVLAGFTSYIDVTSQSLVTVICDIWLVIILENDGVVVLVSPVKTNLNCPSGISVFALLYLH